MDGLRQGKRTVDKAGFIQASGRAGRSGARHIAVVVCPALAACGLLAGCQGPRTESTTGARLRPNAYPYVADIPVPEGFSRDEERSMSDSSGGGRYIEHYYEGKGGKLQARDFYLQEMPAKGWNLVHNREGEEGTCILCFTKPNEPCRVHIRRVPAGLGHKTVVRVLLMSSGGGAGFPDAGRSGSQLPGQP